MTEWPPRSPDLTPCDSFLWGYLKVRIYAKKFNDIEEFKKELIEQFELLNQNKVLLKRVFQNFIKRIQLCIGSEGRQIPV